MFMKYFTFIILFFETEFYCVTLAALERILYARLVLNSQS